MNIRILHTNDIHSRFEGFGKITSKIRELKNDSTLILDAGDFNDFMRMEIQGTGGRAGCSLLSIAGYDALAVGNNEEFAGLEVLETMASTGWIPFISCNLYRNDMSPVRGLNRSIIVDKGGIRFLIIGTTPSYNEFFSLLNMHATDHVGEIRRELEDEKIYKVSTSDYLQRGTGYASLANNQNERYNPEYTRDILREYLNKKEFIEKCFTDRWVKV